MTARKTRVACLTDSFGGARYGSSETEESTEALCRNFEVVRAVCDRSGATQLTHGERRAEYEATRRAAQAAEALSPVRKLRGGR